MILRTVKGSPRVRKSAMAAASKVSPLPHLLPVDARTPWWLRFGPWRDETWCIEYPTQTERPCLTYR